MCGILCSINEWSDFPMRIFIEINGFIYYNNNVPVFLNIALPGNKFHASQCCCVDIYMNLRSNLDESLYSNQK